MDRAIVRTGSRARRNERRDDGYFFAPTGVTFLAGERAQRYRIDASGAFHDDSETPALAGDLHAVWADENGDALAVGGNYVALTRPDVAPKGIVVRYVH